MNIEDVRAFVAVVDTGSVGRAALRLNLTQPAISRRVQRLEEVLGVARLDRGCQPARPCRSGEAASRTCMAAVDGNSAIAAWCLPAIRLRSTRNHGGRRCSLHWSAAARGLVSWRNA